MIEVGPLQSSEIISRYGEFRGSASHFTGSKKAAAGRYCTVALNPVVSEMRDSSTVGTGVECVRFSKAKKEM
jgi:hypothetical protein